MLKNFLLYAATLLVFGAGIFFILELGARLESERIALELGGASSPTSIAPQSQQPEDSSRGVGRALKENLRHPLSILLSQIILILVVVKIVGALSRKVGQPTVVGEMIAGITLGPSLLGLLSPAAMAFLFPPPSMEFLKLLSQVGIILFMFIVGMRLNLQHLGRKAHSVALISHTSIIIPFFLGAAFSLLIYRSFAPPNISFVAFALLMSVAMSITAFPVLARIIEERGLSESYLGNTAIACAALGDVTAWCLLTVVVAIAKADGWGGVMLMVLLTLLYIGVMLFLVKPQIDRIINENFENKTQSRGLMAGILILIFTSALFTELIGIHALFGAFLFGVVLSSRASLRLFLAERLDAFTASFLLPIFFAFTGLRTQLGLLNDWLSWLVCAGIIAVAVAGKLGGSMLAARWTGMTRQDSLALGVLMNTRGLMELIVLNIGYDLGILSPKIFSMMVLMALATTFMTGPLLSLLEFRRRASTA